MTLVQRGVGIFQALREYAPMTTILALIVLPIAIFPTQSDEFATILSQHDPSWLRTIFLVALILSKSNNIFIYAHIGMQRMANFQSCDIWCAPCKSLSFRPFRKPTRLSSWSNNIIKNIRTFDPSLTPYTWDK